MRERRAEIGAGFLIVLAFAVACSGDGGMSPECGNGALEGGEACDDGNTLSCDGCSADCEIETGFVCGDGIVNVACGEECDDGNVVPGDGCDADCQSESCGDGTLSPPEECDDGNATSCDGCSADCEIESGFICGDGIVNVACGEECDDGNVVPGDGCDADCQSESCGDGTLSPPEECDDGNATSCDGCSADCEIESGFICGDGIVNVACGEECDDGNATSCDGCSADCEIESGFICGDGIVNAACGEECDDGNLVPGDGCDDNCQIEDPPLTLTGEYDLDIDVTLDSCGFVDTGPTSSPMDVEETGLSTVVVDIPIGGAGGACNREIYLRSGNTVTRTGSSDQDVGPCLVRADVLTELTFLSGGTVTGFESNALSGVGGDCSGLGLPCAVELSLTGARCTGCFDCVLPDPATAGALLGPIGSASGLAREAVRSPSAGR